MKHKLDKPIILSRGELIESFKTIPANVTELDASFCNLSSATGDVLAEAFKNIPPSVISLNLKGNSFYELPGRIPDKTGKELAIAFKGIPDTVTSLDLSGNDFNVKTLAVVFKALHPNVTSLGLNDFDLNDFDLTAEELTTILPFNIQVVQLANGEIQMAPFHKPRILETLNTQLKILKKKTSELEDRKCTDAHKEAGLLYRTLEDLKNNFQEDKINFNALKSGLINAIKVARPELEKHRGWKEILANIGLCLLGLGVGYLAVCAYNGSFFKFNTDSADKLNTLKVCLDNSVPAL